MAIGKRGLSPNPVQRYLVKVPGLTMGVASRVLRVAAPELDPPQAVRSDGCCV